MKVWLDDVRIPPDKTWVWVRSAVECILLLIKNWDDITDISLDHDLWDGFTGYFVAEWIEERAFNGEFDSFPNIKCHSANPAGRYRIEQAIDSAFEYYQETRKYGKVT